MLLPLHGWRRYFAVVGQFMVEKRDAAFKARPPQPSQIVPRNNHSVAAVFGPAQHVAPVAKFFGKFGHWFPVQHRLQLASCVIFRIHLVPCRREQDHCYACHRFHGEQDLWGHFLFAGRSFPCLFESLSFLKFATKNRLHFLFALAEKEREKLCHF